MVSILYCFLLLVSCTKNNCENRGGGCPSYPDNVISPLNFVVGDSIRFKNDLGFEIGFRVSQSWKRFDTEYGCALTGTSNCDCDDCVSGHGFIARTEDEPWSSLIDLNNISINENYSYSEGKIITNPLSISIRVIDGHNNAEINSSNFLESFELGGIKYSDVLILDGGSLGHFDNTVEIISKIYVSKTQGVIGFDENETPSTFYLTE